MPGLAERLSIIIEATGIGAISEFKKVGASAKKELGEVDKATQTTRTQGGLLGKGLDKLGLSSIDTGTAMKVALAGGATAAGVALVKFGKDGVEAFSNATLQVTNFRRVAGGTAEDSSRLVAAMNTLHVDVEAGAKAFGILSKNIENTPKKLEEIGIAVAHNKNGTADLAGTLLNVSDAYNATADAAQKNVIALTAFGKGGLALAPILAKGRAGLKELYAEAAKHHEIFSEKDLQNGVKFRLATTELSQAFHGLEIEAGQRLVPALTDSAVELTHLIEAGDKFAQSRLGSALAGIGDVVLNRAGPALGNFRTAITGASSDTTKVGEAASGAAYGFDTMANAEADAATKAKDLADAQEAANKQMLAAPGNALAYDQALLSLQGDIASQTDLQKAYNDAVKQYGANSAEAKAAALQLAQGQDTLKGDILGAAAAYAQLTVPQGTAAQQAHAEIDALGQMEQKFPALTPIIEGYIAELAKIPGAINTNVAITGADIPANSRGERLHLTADGGVFNGPQVRVIGEAGPEAVVPLGSSARATQARARVMRQAGLGWADGGIAGVGGNWGSGTVFKLVVNASGYQEGQAAGAAVIDAIKQYERRNGISWRAS